VKQYRIKVLDGIAKTNCNFSDRVSLKEPEKVEKIQRMLCNCLRHLFTRRVEPMCFEKIIAVCLDMRTLAAWDLKIMQDMFEVWPLAENHQLVKEFVTF